MTRAPDEHDGTVPLTITDQAVLYASYMPFVTHGGLFIRTGRTCALGDKVVISLSLLGDEAIPITGTVVWLTPAGAQGARPAGIGVQFNSSDDLARSRIENHLGATVHADRPTDTM